MFKWASQLYIGEKARSHQGALIREIEEGRLTSKAYILTLPVNEANQLELVPVKDLFWRTASERTPLIVGVAEDKKEAMDLFEQIAKETLAARGDADIKSYIRDRESVGSRQEG